MDRLKPGRRGRKKTFFETPKKASNCAALWPIDPIIDKSYNYINTSAFQEAGRLGFALSKRHHFHSVHILREQCVLLSIVDESINF